MNRKIFFPLFCFLLIFYSTLAQDKKNWTFRGYVKDMQTWTYFQPFKTTFSDNLLHNRLNFKWYPSQKITGALEIRNRIFWGDGVVNNPDYIKNINPYSSFLDLGHGERWLNGGVAWYSNIDRLWMRYSIEKLEITLGRQRINWGINTAWNSNDLFNTYNFVDFDYEERPGSDALRIQYYTGPLSSIEMAVKPGKTEDENVAALLYRFNKWSYDIQFLSGIYYTDIALGTGWAGNIKTLGFKGEVTYFHPRDNFSDTSGVISASTGIDYLFANNLYLNFSLLYNSNGINKMPSTMAGNGFFTAPITAKNLMPTVLTFFVNGSFPITPLVGSSVAVLYTPGVDAFFIMPSLTYSIKENWDIDFIGQTLFLGAANGPGHYSSTVFLRLKWSF